MAGLGGVGSSCRGETYASRSRAPTAPSVRGEELAAFTRLAGSLRGAPCRGRSSQSSRTASALHPCFPAPRKGVNEGAAAVQPS
jgi:hypothetical protein